MKPKELKENIKRIKERLAGKRTIIIGGFRKKLEEKGVAYLMNKLNQ
jgi:Ni,Fe-hydrogenase III large subunit